MIRFFIAAAVVFVLAKCGDDKGSIPPSLRPVDKDKELVTNLSQHLIKGKVDAFQSAAVQLNQSAQQACGTQAQVAELKQNWQIAMTHFHGLDTMAYGPLAENAGQSARGALGDRIYSWPVSNDLGVQRQLEKAHKKPDQYRFRNDKFSIIGLDAVEYILFENLKDTQIVDAGSEVCPYLPLLTNDLMQAAGQLQNSFETKEVHSLAAKTSVADYREVIQRMVQALQFIENMVFERKLAAPLGKNKKLNCEINGNCDLYLEHPYSKMAKEAMLMNLDMLIEIYTGGVGFGFEDYLVQLGETQRAEEFLRELQSLRKELQDAPGKELFFVNIKNFNENECGEGSICSIYKRMQKVALWIKGDFLVLMSKELPVGVQGDND